MCIGQLAGRSDALAIGSVDRLYVPIRILISSDRRGARRIEKWSGRTVLSSDTDFAMICHEDCP
jgi:hypothetical protein